MSTKPYNFQIPPQVSHVTSTLEKGVRPDDSVGRGYEAWIVGGCVRDLILGRTPKDWDVTTNATPEQIQALFTKTVYENKFGTVAVILEPSTDYPLQTTNFIVEVTPFRTESEYSDFRHPDQVSFAETLDEDLSRRDFTMNALAYGHDGEGKPILRDIFDGIKDIEKKIIKTVGDPEKRFSEDALRMMRAVRFASELGFSISHETSEAIVSRESLLEHVSEERIRDEFVKIINSDSPAMGITFLVKLGLMKHIIPELLEGIGCEQGGVHIYDVFDHLCHALQHAADKDFPFHVKLAALFHDIGKPRTRRPGHKKAYTFYGHEVVGARMAAKIMDRLKFPKSDTELVVKLVRWHMFFSDTEQITLSAVRRMIANVANKDISPTSRQEITGTPQDKLDDSLNHPIWTLMQIRECDRVGMKKAEAPYRLRKYHAMIEECLRDPISVKQLKINGEYLIKELGMKPGPRMGWTLHALLEEVLDDPKKNTREYLDARVGELEKLSDKELKALGEEAKKTKEDLEEAEVKKLHKKHGV